MQVSSAGAINKNYGDTFIIVWRLDLQEDLERDRERERERESEPGWQKAVSTTIARPCGNMTGMMASSSLV